MLYLLRPAKPHPIIIKKNLVIVISTLARRPLRSPPSSPRATSLNKARIAYQTANLSPIYVYDKHTLLCSVDLT